MAVYRVKKMVTLGKTLGVRVYTRENPRCTGVHPPYGGLQAGET